MRSTGPRPGQSLLLDFFYVVPLLAFPMPASFLVSQPENGHIAAANGPSRAAITAQARLAGTSPPAAGGDSVLDGEVERGAVSADLRTHLHNPTGVGKW